MVRQNCSSFLMERNRQTYNTDPNNLKANKSFHYNGLMHHWTLGMEPGPDSKGIVVVMKQRSRQ
ncbi:hypothetical protein GH733_019103 [Mirounga leonina]|nr:hypothetical protein GH733_019103 [Mirounga leonina]